MRSEDVVETASMAGGRLAQYYSQTNLLKHCGNDIEDFESQIRMMRRMGFELHLGLSLSRLS